MSSGEYSGTPEVFPVERTPTSDGDQEKPPRQTELYVVEGRSAALSVAALRDREFQAVMGLQGKPLNSHRASPARVAAHPFYSLLTQQIEGEHAGSRLILLFDPDADGIHCSALLLGFLLKFHSDVISGGRVFAARAPIMEVVTRRTRPSSLEPEQLDHSQSHSNGIQEVFYAYADGNSSRLLRDVRLAGLEITGRRYFRGLGGIPPEILRGQCVDPKSRYLIPVSTAEAEASVSIFLGSKR